MIGSKHRSNVKETSFLNKQLHAEHFYMFTLNGITAVFGICVIWTLLLGNLAKIKLGTAQLKIPLYDQNKVSVVSYIITLHKQFWPLSFQEVGKYGYIPLY